MDVDAFFAKLEKARYFEGYTEEAIARATKAIRKKLTAGLKGPHAAEFGRFPGLSLVVLDVDQEMIGVGDLKHVLQRFGRASFGLFKPRAIRVQRTAGEDRYELRFIVNDATHCMVLENDSWIPDMFFASLDHLTKIHCWGLKFHAVEYPDPGQSGFYLWCTGRAFQAISRAKLIPSKRFPLYPREADCKPATPALSEPAEVNRFSTLPPPADPTRAERLRVFEKGTWKVLSFSKATLADWDKIATGGAATAVGDELAKQIGQTFDLLCARHCGVTGLGDATTDAKRVVALVDRYLFGTWRVGHEHKGVTFTTEAMARKELMWSGKLPEGCAAAAFLDNRNALCQLLEYPRGEVYESPLGDELAFYRLLSDLALQRQEFDWEQQTNVIRGGFDDRLKLLLQCLRGLRDGDEAGFRKALAKLATTRVFNPIRYANVVDCEVTVIAYLAQQKGWSRDPFPQRIQDQILAWQTPLR